MRPGMRLSEALATCPDLVLAEQDPAAAEEEWEGGDAARTRHVTERRWTCVVVVVTLDGEQRILALEGAAAP